MQIRSVEISALSASGLKSDVAGIEHIKIIPCLSVVQALHGGYKISLDGDELEEPGEGGVFISPAESLQRIIHCNGDDGYMEAHWAFMNVTVNGIYPAEKIFNFPKILPSCENAAIEKLIKEVRASDRICRKYAAAYEIVDILFKYSSVRPQLDIREAKLREYIAEHFRENIGIEELAATANCSVPQVYRLFKKYFSMSPANYINFVRLQHAILLLEMTNESVTDIAINCGFNSASYFSNLFKTHIRCSPEKYRQKHFAPKK